MKEAVRGFFTEREGMARVWSVLLMICAVLVTIGYSAKAGNAGETPPPEPNPVEEAEPPVSSEIEEPGENPLPPEEETAQTPENSGEETPEETPNTEEPPITAETPNAGETPAGNSAGAKPLSASFTQEGLDQLVQQAIDGIITPGMTRLEQAKAVWKFAKNGISYTGKSDKSEWRAGAYEGLRTRRGDCFTYYAVSRALLTALGIDNLEVQRVGGPTSHYWNLVNCGDGWYHFDATPRSSKMPYFVSFMFTDKEAADYTARAGRNYYSFDGSLYPQRAGGAKAEPAPAAPPAESPAPEAPPAENPLPETPPVEAPAPEAPPAEEPTPEAPPAEEPAPEAPPTENPTPEAPPAEEPAPETPPAEDPDTNLFPVDAAELPPAAETE